MFVGALCFGYENHSNFNVVVLLPFGKCIFVRYLATWTQRTMMFIMPDGTIAHKTRWECWGWLPGLADWTDWTGRDGLDGTH